MPQGGRIIGQYTGPPPAGVSEKSCDCKELGSILSPRKNPRCDLQRGFLVWMIPAITYFRAGMHYHRPWKLNGRVRNGNVCGLPSIVTGN